MANLGSRTVELFSPQAEIRWRYMWPWKLLANDVSSKFFGGGSIFNYYTAQDLAVAPVDEVITSGLSQDVTPQVLMIDESQLTVDQKKQLLVAIPEVETFQNVYDATSLAMERMENSEKIVSGNYTGFNPMQNAFIKSRFVAGADRVGTNINLSAAQILSFNDAVRTVLFTDLLAKMVEADDRSWPNDRRVCILNNKISASVVKWLTEEGRNMGVGAIVDSAFVRGKVAMIYNWELIPDKSIDVTAGANKTVFHYLVPGVSIDWAEQYSSFDPRTHYANRNIYYNGYKVYGAHVPDSAKAMTTRATIAA